MEDFQIIDKCLMVKLPEEIDHYRSSYICEKADDMIKALKKAAGFIRRELGFRVDLRYTPELIFERDRNIAYGVHIAQVLRDVAPKEENEENAGEE